jgi:hypothetical protein
MKNTSCVDKHIYFKVIFFFKVGWVRPKCRCLPLCQHITHSPDDMSLKNNGGMIYWRGKTKELREKPVTVPLCPPHIPHGLTPGVCSERPATNDLSHGTAFKVSYKTNSLNMFGPISGGRNLPTLYGSCTLTSLTQRVLPDRQQCTQLLNFEPKYTCRYIH